MIDSFTPSSGMIRKVQRAATTFASLHQDNTTLADTQSVSSMYHIFILILYQRKQNLFSLFSFCDYNNILHFYK